jgi:hypothetical protein
MTMRMHAAPSTARLISPAFLSSGPQRIRCVAIRRATPGLGEARSQL